MDTEPQAIRNALTQLSEWITTGRARELREHAHMSRLSVAAEMQVWPSTIARWESGERTPRGRSAIEYYTLLAELNAEQRAL
jgi:transcriptional regulator with XRE-family HTH domain